MLSLRILSLADRLRQLYPHETIVLSGSCAYGEALVINGDLKSDIDFNIVTSFRKFFQILKEKGALKEIKEEFLRETGSKVNFQVVPKKFLEWSFERFHGIVISSSWPKIEQYLRRDDLDKNTLINSLKIAFRELIKARIYKDPISLAKAAKHFLIAEIVYSARSLDSGFQPSLGMTLRVNIFSLSALLDIVPCVGTLRESEKELLVQILRERLVSDLSPYSYRRWFLLRQLIVRLYTQIKNSFTPGHYFLYNFHFLPKKNFNFLFRSPNRIVLEALYYLSLSFWEKDVNPQNLIKCLKIISKFDKLNYALKKEEVPKWCYEILNKYVSIVWVI